MAAEATVRKMKYFLIKSRGGNTGEHSGLMTPLSFPAMNIPSFRVGDSHAHDVMPDDYSTSSKHLGKLFVLGTKHIMVRGISIVNEEPTSKEDKGSPLIHVKQLFGSKTSRKKGSST